MYIPIWMIKYSVYFIYIFFFFSELCEEWALANSRECVDNGNGKIGNGSGSSLSNDDHEKASEATFTLKYLGSTLVETPSSEEATAEAIKTVITMVRNWNNYYHEVYIYSNVNYNVRSHFLYIIHQLYLYKILQFIII